VAAVIAHQLPQIGHDQREQHRDADGVDQQDPVQPLRIGEVIGVFGDAGEREQRDQPEVTLQELIGAQGGGGSEYDAGNDAPPTEDLSFDIDWASGVWIDSTAADGSYSVDIYFAPMDGW
jgi:hypothetical protein